MESRPFDSQPKCRVTNCESKAAPTYTYCPWHMCTRIVVSNANKGWFERHLNGIDEIVEVWKNTDKDHNA